MILTAAGTPQPFVEDSGSMALTPSTMLPLGTPLPQGLLDLALVGCLHVTSVATLPLASLTSLNLSECACE